MQSEEPKICIGETMRGDAMTTPYARSEEPTKCIGETIHGGTMTTPDIQRTRRLLVTDAGQLPKLLGVNTVLTRGINFDLDELAVDSDSSSPIIMPYSPLASTPRKETKRKLFSGDRRSAASKSSTFRSRTSLTLPPSVEEEEAAWHALRSPL